MKPQSRKLQMQDNDVSIQPITTFLNSNSTPSPPFKKPTTKPSPTTPTPPTPPPFQQLQYSNQPFESSMALTVLVLITALFFMGFFSIYLRRFSIDPTEEFSSHRRRQRLILRPPVISDRPSWTITTTRRGLDPEVVKSLPVFTYYHGDAKYQLECAICLGEFEEKETVKMMPNCEHVFHLECIDTWLKMHMTCPVCRGTQFFEVERKIGDGADLRVTRERVDDQGGSEIHGRSTVENSDTLVEVREVGTIGVRRTISCSSLGERMLLQRTSSF